MVFWEIWPWRQNLQTAGNSPESGPQGHPHSPLMKADPPPPPAAFTLGCPLPHVEQFEVVLPQRLPGPRARRDLSSQLGLYPETVSYLLGARGHSFTLHLRKNKDLLGSSYAETYSNNGSEVTEQLHLQGHVEGHPSSAASLSTCAGLRGFFQAGSAVHLIEPLDGAEEAGPHALYLAEHLQQESGTCGVSDTSLNHLLGPRVSAAFRPWPRNGPLPRETRFVELYVVTDSAEFQKLGSRDAVRRRVLEVVNHVDKLYQELNFRVVLVGLEIWNNGDKFQVSPNPEVTLENFLTWRVQELAGRHPHDNVQLITGVDFTGTTVGLAKVSAMCSHQSGAVNQDHSQSPVGVASTMAHEMGHNLGMDHDENVQGCYCPVPRAGGGCVMAASIGSSFPRTFSHCSQADLEMFVEKPHTACLANTPDLDRLVGGPVCGNRFVEHGEQCDCGPPQDCHNRCCNATTCQLAEGAECAQGACCHECRVKPAAEPCRPQKDECDLEEFCDGLQPTCPEDAFQENGTPCQGGYCYNGSCPTLAQRCQDFWGPGARAAAETCFSYSVLAGCSLWGPLGMERVKCGVLLCEGGRQPLERSTCTFNPSSVVCQALATDNGVAYEMVPEGTKCGQEKVCWEGRCQDLRVYRSRNCSAQCHGHGVCNHKKECHCHRGWAPPFCTELLRDVQAASGSLLVSVLVVFGVLVVMAVILAVVIVHRKSRNHVQRRDKAPKTTSGLFNPLFREGAGSKPAPRQGPSGLAPTSCPSQSPRPKLPSAVSSPPFPLPVYTQQSPEQLRPVAPSKPLLELKPKQVVKPTSAPPMPPVKPGVGGAKAGLMQGVAGPKVPLKPPVQRR
ncbi:disintegrin and metalloproteinase domain-containing protein 8 isoform X2 [Nycticebus coucang]|uniref:disintegrin and metalloproteinase domain-containing protein 8 isoform X2 n=1 Tax=Nycticebus coucang TaxID=9470 RepID=UPI00234DB20C|nr:disintegrin and metalloproteinase domain-containing protein 8 isoform X2 [Nycticebus coucang]